MKKFILSPIFLLGLCCGSQVWAQVPGPSPLCDAVVAANVAQVKQALASGAVPDQECRPGLFATYLAATGILNQQGLADANIEITRALLKAGAQPNRINTIKRGWGRRTQITSFMVIAQSLRLDLIELALQSGADVNLQASARTPLSYVAWGTPLTHPGDLRLKVINRLIQAGASVMKISGETSLLSAFLGGGYDEAIELEAIQNWDFTKEMKSPSSYVEAILSRERSLAVYQALINRGAAANLIPTEGSNKGREALLIFVRSVQATDQDQEFVHFLLQKTTDINTEGGAILRFAVTQQPIWLLTEILNAGGDPRLKSYGDSSNWYGQALHYTVGPTDGVARAKLLLKFKAPLEGLSSSGETPLAWAARYENLTLTQFFVSRGAKVNHRDDSGMTALCSCQSEEVRRYLISVGALRLGCPAN